jgi:hypothetical protein
MALLEYPPSMYSEKNSSDVVALTENGAGIRAKRRRRAIRRLSLFISNFSLTKINFDDNVKDLSPSY